MITLTQREIMKLMPHIKVIAKKYSGYNVPFEDLVQEGVLGIYKAKEHYNQDIGGSFAAYAIWWIKQSILNALSEQSKLVHLPFGKINLFRKISQIKDLYFQKYGRDATETEAKRELQLNSETYFTTLNSNTISIDENINNDEDLTIKDLLTSSPDIEQKYDVEDLRFKLNNLLKSLDTREKFIITNFFGINVEKTMSLEDIGEKLGLTRERCRQLKQIAIDKLKLNSKKLLD
jgi:RNA polymerase primary sigma factor